MAGAITPLSLGSLGGLKVVPVQQRSPFINLLIYGESGVGKTTLAGSADEVEALSPALVIDIEGGTEALVRPYPNVKTVRVTTWLEMQAVYDDLRRMNHPYKTVILDSLTEIQKFNMYNVMIELLKEHPDRDPDVPSMREWGINLEQMRKYVRAFRDLPINTIFTALLREDKDQVTGRVTMKPSLSGKMAGEIAAFLDIVGYYYVKQVGVGEEAVMSRLLLTRKTDKQVAKDRTGRLPMVMQEPTMKDIWEFVTLQRQPSEQNELETLTS
jgi:AAA domain-containing protein